jgi:hypothetical protein
MAEPEACQDISTSSDVSTARGAKRSRSGCLTCRKRRRKCTCCHDASCNVPCVELNTWSIGDENRPVCHNCVAKGLECRYAALYQILGKNNYTPRVENKAHYANVQVREQNSFFSKKNPVLQYSEDSQTNMPNHAQEVDQPQSLKNAKHAEHHAKKHFFMENRIQP